MNIDKIDPIKTKKQIVLLFFLFLLALLIFTGHQLKIFSEVKEIDNERKIIVMILDEEKPENENEIEIKEETIQKVVEEEQEVVEKEKEQDVICDMLFQPVVSEDGKIYDNTCLAEKAGVEVSEEKTYKMFNVDK